MPTSRGRRREGARAVSDYLDRLVARALGVEPAVRPRLPSRFERVVPDAAVDPTEPAVDPRPAAHRLAPPVRNTLAGAPDAAAAASTERPTVSRATGPAAVPPDRLERAPAGSPVARAAPEEVRQPTARSEAAAGPMTPAPTAAPSPAEGLPPAVRPQPLVTLSPVAQRRAARSPAVAVEAPPRAATPVVRVTIGRVEVRAAPPPREVRAARSAPGPRLTLDAYLRQRDEGKR
jgi:hypothetical protein